MNQFVKSVLAIGITSALSISLISHVNAATYEIIAQGEASKLKYTYAQHQNSAGDMAISGTDIYNFPVQFDYLDDDDFDAIESYVFSRYLSVNGLNNIEDSGALRTGNPTANDLAWVVRWLQDTSSGKGLYKEYQKVGDIIALTNIGGVTTDFNLWDVKFDGTDTFTRSTTDIISGITDNGISYGTATAPYLPLAHTDSHNIESISWMREFAQRGFFSFNHGVEVFPLIPLETDYSGGISAVVDVHESGIAVGFSSYKISDVYIDYIENGAIETIDDKEVDRLRKISGISDFVQFDLNNPSDGIDDELDEDYIIRGCSDPYILKHMLYNVCVHHVEQALGSSPYHIMAVKSALSANGEVVTESLGLLAPEPHPDDVRPYSSYALAVNSQGVAVGYADGFNDETKATPDVDEKRYFHYAVVFKDGEVVDLSGEHTNLKGSSRAYDINDAGIAVGHITKLISGKSVEKFFYVDTNVSKDEVNMINPDDYFNGSDSTARAINNSGLIVGEGEVETHNESDTNPRRTAAFVYNINDDIFANINELIPCDMRLTYDIIEARGVNDAGMISATAIVKADRRDAKGEIMLDDNGTPLKEDVVRAISLNPIPDDGEVCTAEEEGKVERKGAGIGFGSAWLLVAILGLRRRLFN